jgi:alpha-N-arabinofuranosidase
MQAYAPLLVNVNPKAYQWPTNLIGYDALSSFGSPSYYAQQMFNAERGDVVLATSADVAPGLFTSATRVTRTGVIYLKVVNTRAAPCALRVEITGVAAVDTAGFQVQLAGQPLDVNSLQEPRKIAPIEAKRTGLGKTFDATFPGYSITVLALQSHD